MKDEKRNEEKKEKSLILNKNELNQNKLLKEKKNLIWSYLINGRRETKEKEEEKNNIFI